MWQGGQVGPPHMDSVCVPGLCMCCCPGTRGSAHRARGCSRPGMSTCTCCTAQLVHRGATLNPVMHCGLHSWRPATYQATLFTTPLQLPG